MDRMKTFLIYALIVIGLFAFSKFVEEYAIVTSYGDIAGQTNGEYIAENDSNSNLYIQKVSAKARRGDGYINFRIYNTTANFIEKCYLKISLYNERNQLAATQYVEVNDLNPGEKRDFSVKFKANNIKNYEISIIEEMPDKTNIINVLGWEIDLTDIFGYDLTNLKLFGINVKDVFNWNHAKKKGMDFWMWLQMKVRGVPTWAYIIGFFWFIV